MAGRQAVRIQWEVQSLQRQSNLTLLRTNARDQHTAMLSVQADEVTAEADNLATCLIQHMTDTIAALYMYSGVSFGSNLLQSNFQETKYRHPRDKVGGRR